VSGELQEQPDCQEHVEILGVPVQLELLDPQDNPAYQEQMDPQDRRVTEDQRGILVLRDR